MGAHVPCGITQFNPSIAIVFFKTYIAIEGVNDPQVYIGFCAT